MGDVRLMRDRLRGRWMRCLSYALLAASWSAAVTAAEPAPGLEPRLDRLACGSTVVIAQASCYGTTRMCIRETLTFHRPEGRTVLAPHKQLGRHKLHDGRTVEALDYHASEWACVTGSNGGRYVAFIMARTTGGNCSECEYFRLYHPNGRLIASTLIFDAAGRPRKDPKASELISKMVDRPRPDAFEPVYAR